MNNLTFNKKLGFGFFRLPMNNHLVDIEKCNILVDEFINQGFNYFDVARPYCEEQSESTFKKCVAERYKRNEYILANKLTHGYFKSKEDIYDLFEHQLATCGVEYFDIYLMHCQVRATYDDFQKCQAYEVAQDLKRQGKIKYVGFSFHDSAEFLETILTDHPEIDVVQLQINYFDYDDGVIQSRLCLETCIKHNKPVIVMEPIKGGTLINLPKAAEDLLRAIDSHMSNASYAIRFAASCKNVCMVLSGMNELSQVIDNTSYMKDFQPLDETTIQTLQKVRDILQSKGHIQCTNCKYCVKGCPKKIQIPNIMSSINAKSDLKYNFQIDEYYWTAYTHNVGKASDCIKCGKCEKACPQHLPIRKHLNRAVRLFETQEGYYDDILDIVVNYKNNINNQFIIYGAGKYGKMAVDYFSKNIPDINIINIAISQPPESCDAINGIEIKGIADLQSYKKSAMVLLMSIVPANIQGMWQTLKDLEFDNMCDLFGNSTN